MADLPTSNVICRYYLENTCRAGDDCKFIHDVKLGLLDDECRSYRVTGKCRYGRRCFYDHVRYAKDGSPDLISKGTRSLQRELSRIRNPPEESDSQEPKPTDPALLPLCREYEISGTCSSKDCFAAHGGLCRHCEKYVIHPHNRYFNLMHESECKPREATVPTLREELLKASADLMCGVCLDTVYEKSGKGSKRFGILSNCPHVFCWECVHEWRKGIGSGMRKTCPECRTPSDIMTPAVFHVRQGDVKEALLKEHENRSMRKKLGASSARPTLKTGPDSLDSHFPPDLDLSNEFDEGIFISHFLNLTF